MTLHYVTVHDLREVVLVDDVDAPSAIAQALDIIRADAERRVTVAAAQIVPGVYATVGEVDHRAEVTQQELRLAECDHPEIQVTAVAIDTPHLFELGNW